MKGLNEMDMDMDINGIAERIQDASELSYSYYKSLVDRIVQSVWQRHLLQS